MNDAAIQSLLGPDPHQQDPNAVGMAAGLPSGLYPAVIGVESGGRDEAVSKKGAVGMAQVLPSSAARPGFGIQGGNPHDLNTGARILAGYIKQAKGDIAKGLAMYNAGPHADPSIAKDYANKVIGRWKPTPEQLLGPDPSAPSAMSPLASQPPQPSQPSASAQQQPQAPQQPPVSKTIMDAINRPADRTVELMSQAPQQTWQAIKTLVAHPSVRSATNAALNVVGVPFSPITSAVDAFLGDPMVQLAHSLGASPKTDPYIRTAAQMVLPLAGAKSAALKAALGEEGAFLTGGLTPEAPPLTPGQSAGVIAQKLIKHDQAEIARDVQLRRSRDEFLADNPHYAKFDEELFHAGEDPTAKLSPEAAFFKKTYLDPMKRRNDAYIQEAAKLGVKLPKEMVQSDRYMHRQAIDVPVDKSLLTRMAETVDPTGALSNIAPTKGIGTKPEIFQKPLAGKATSSVTGEEGGYVIRPETGMVNIYKNGKVVDQGTLVSQKGGGQYVMTKNGGLWDLTRGTTAEVEAHTPVRYYKSAMGSMLETQRQLRDVVANAKFMQGLRTSPEFQTLSRPPKSASPKDWRAVEIPGYYGFKGWKFHPRLAEVLEDYTNVKQDPNQMLQGVNRLIQGSIFINPMGHIFNVQFHAAIEAGLFGGLTRTIEGAVRAITPGEKTLTRRAIESVVNKDADYLRYVRESPGMKGANNYVRNFSNETLKLMGKDPAKLDGTARIFGLRSGADFIRMVYGASNKTLWGVGDMILMKAFLAKEAETGETAAKVAASVHEHIPSYVVPSRVFGVRGIGQLVHSPYSLGFSRYEYNRLESYANLVKGVVQQGHRGEAMDQIAALVFHAAVTYPMIDYAVQKATGNPHATFHGYGPFIFTENLNQYGRGEKTAAQAGVQAIARPGAAVETLMEVYQNKDWAGRPVYGHGSHFMKYLASKTYPTEALSRLVSPPKGVTKQQAIKQFLFEQVGIKSPTAAQYANTRKYAEQELQKRRTNKP